MKYLVCNFKNKLLKEDIIKYNMELGEIATRKSKLVVCPSALFLSYFDKSGYSLGAQDISSFMEKTITGEITGEQLSDLGVTYVLVGHSERRECNREISINFINKINNAISNNINVIYCIGETLNDKENGNTYMILEKQISEVLNNVELRNIKIAYEPVWAIGTGVTPKMKEIEETIQFIKDITSEKYEVNLEVLYGGSVKVDNFNELLSIKNIDGFLVGGASLNAKNVKIMLEEMEK